jgi:MerR family copper efflux transcriptional regulator
MTDPITCTLDAADRTARLTHARELGEQALVGLEVSGSRAVLRFAGASESVDALVAAEQACCAFFEFSMTRLGEDTELEIRTPAGGEALLRALVAGIVAGWKGGIR